jgi:hypothetical protein
MRGCFKLWGEAVQAAIGEAVAEKSRGEAVGGWVGGLAGV